MNLTLNEELSEKLEAFSQILEKKPMTIVNEALESYFKQAEKMILEKSMSEKDPDTDISFDEFWDGVDV
ncbi:hypothetical protein JHD50_01670 [Sulfurimonas sp. MAG313]|nr:hypothetical protein [Sulfurimonas sp. MAG313]MDF1880018.1 hypothetical protein [Sulfurimonas sp. MAG313]